MKLRCDEAHNLHGKKVRVKAVKWYNEKNHIIQDFYLFYDEAEVYHIENSTTRKIVQAFECNGWYKALEVALALIKNEEDAVVITVV